MLRWPVELQPKLLTVLREGIPARTLLSDAFAGLVVGVVALPLAIAFAIASGLRPEQGLVTGIVAGMAISLLGGSRVQIGGPTVSFVVIVSGVVARHGYDGLAVAMFMAGVLLIVMGLARLGTVIRFVPYPVTVGFTSGMALIIAAGQVPDALGLALGGVPAGFAEKWTVYGEHLGSTSPAALALCAATIVIVQLWPRVSRRLPGPLVALVATSLAAYAAGLPVETIGSRFGAVPTGLPVPRLPQIEWSRVSELVSPAVSIALLAGIESLLSALVADGMTGRRHRSNAELVGQGVANLLSPLFGGIPSAGAIARTATNVRNGGTTPVAGVVHSLTLLGVLVFAGRLAEAIPLATLAGILLVVAYNMSEWRVFARLLRGPRSDVLVLITTFALTVLVDLSVAIQAGVVLAALLLMRRMAEVTQVRQVDNPMDYREEGDTPVAPGPPLPAGVEVFEINGSFCFGAAQKFTEVVGRLGGRPAVVILRMRDVLAIDATGLNAVEELAHRLAHDGTELLLSGVRAQPLAAMGRSGLAERLGSERLRPSYADAVERARVRVDTRHHRPG